MKKLTERDYRISGWSGGETIQIAIAPEGARYADRDFLWRLSSATVSLDESDFTALPDYMRLIAPISGSMRLSHNGGDPVELRPYEIHRFDGADSTHSWGRCTDFNLMLRKGECDGRIAPAEGGAAEEIIIFPEAGAEVILIYCTEGGVAVSCGNDRLELAEREAALLQGVLNDPVRIVFLGFGRVITAQVWR